jgi:hypothetical protein
MQDKESIVVAVRGSPPQLAGIGEPTCQNDRICTLRNGIGMTETAPDRIVILALKDGCMSQLIVS